MNADSEYNLIDSGDGMKLERFGQYVLARPDPQILWHRALTPAIWNNADARFVRKDGNAKWLRSPKLPKSWPMQFFGLTFLVRPTTFKHTGVFPEQYENWVWLDRIVRNSKRKDIKVLNLFGYTGGATLTLLRAGAEVCHVDASKTSLEWARENAVLSGLADRPVRWILDDAKAFVKREIKRGKKYDGIVMDPPAFGHGPKGDVWKLEENLSELLELCRELLSDKPLFFVVNGYASHFSHITYRQLLEQSLKLSHGVYESGELVLSETDMRRVLVASIYARWSC